MSIVESREALPQPPLSIRGHHVADIAKIALRYPREESAPVIVLGELVRPADFYKHPLLGHQYLSEVVAATTDDWLGAYADGSNTGVLFDDYLGKEGAGARVFQEGKTMFLSQIFLASPETIIEINTLPDAICRSCQSTPQGEVGLHCRGEKSEDALYVRIINEVLLEIDDSYQGGLNEINGDANHVKLQAGVLRDSEFLNLVKQKREADSPSFSQLIQAFLGDPEA